MVRVKILQSASCCLSTTFECLSWRSSSSLARRIFLSSDSNNLLKRKIVKNYFVSGRMSKETIKWVCPSFRRRNEGVLCECNTSYSFSSTLCNLFCSWSEDMHMLWTLLSKKKNPHFSTCKHRYFSPSQRPMSGYFECNCFNLSETLHVFCI